MFLAAWGFRMIISTVNSQADNSLFCWLERDIPLASEMGLEMEVYRPYSVANGAASDEWTWYLKRLRTMPIRKPHIRNSAVSTIHEFTAEFQGSPPIVAGRRHEHKAFPSSRYWHPSSTIHPVRGERQCLLPQSAHKLNGTGIKTSRMAYSHHRPSTVTSCHLP
jgi:hypothetical protein